MRVLFTIWSLTRKYWSIANQLALSSIRSKLPIMNANLIQIKMVLTRNAMVSVLSHLITNIIGHPTYSSIIKSLDVYHFTRIWFILIQHWLFCLNLLQQLQFCQSPRTGIHVRIECDIKLTPYHVKFSKSKSSGQLVQSCSYPSQGPRTFQSG